LKQQVAKVTSVA